MQSEEKRKVKLQLSMNLHGLATVDSAVLHEDEEYEEPVTVTPAAPAANGTTAAEQPAAAEGEAPMEAEPSEPAAAGKTCIIGDVARTCKFSLVSLVIVGSVLVLLSHSLISVIRQHMQLQAASWT